MNNPYDFLGVGRNADERQIMDAYRRMAGEIQNSVLSDSEKVARMNELNNAYDKVLNDIRGNVSYNPNSDTNHYQYQTDSQYADVRQYLNTGRIDYAETILDGMPQSMRGAEWHFLKGVIHQRRGWLNEAYRSYQTACSMDPSNAEYATAFNAMNNNANGGYKTSNKNVSPCDICTGLLCADCCCECMGGDLIPCC